MSAREAVERSLSAVARSEATVQAWAYLDADRARDEAALVDERPPAPLSGVTLGVKDIFDTADLPTEFGSAIYTGHRPRSDAAAVALLRQAGAVCLGKTVTAEFAGYHPGPTTNPHRATHTPGGSSMGSAAAVAAGMVDVALGTQTAASVVRPASFCGTYGFKPSFGTVPVAGMKPVAPSLDTVGWFARRPDLLERVWTCLTGRVAAPSLTGPPRVALVRTEQWEECSADSARAVEEVADRFRRAGAPVDLVEIPAELVGLADDHRTVMAYEAARSLAYEHAVYRAQLSDNLCQLLDEGRSVPPVAYDTVRARTVLARTAVAGVFRRHDVILTPVAVGEAPAGLSYTGDPRFGRLWTMLGLPAVAVPGPVGGTGLPVGVQLIGGQGADGGLLAVTAWLAGVAA
jgi:Asp-tRNA(Asn)/Glu-tRNA(Gln) amidotransferase A subunit family amidase